MQDEQTNHPGQPEREPEGLTDFHTAMIDLILDSSIKAVQQMVECHPLEAVSYIAIAISRRVHGVAFPDGLPAGRDLWACWQEYGLPAFEEISEEAEADLHRRENAAVLQWADELAAAMAAMEAAEAAGEAARKAEFERLRNAPPANEPTPPAAPDPAA